MPLLDSPNYRLSSNYLLRMWRRVDLVCLLLHLLSIASLWCEASAQCGADGSETVTIEIPQECIETHCVQYLQTGADGPRIINYVECIRRHCVPNPQTGAVGPRITNPMECIGMECEQYCGRAVSGFIFILMALTMAGWGFVKSSHESTIGRAFATLFVSVLNPLAIIWHMLYRAVDGMAMADNLREAVGADKTAPLYPWIPVIMGTEVVVNLSQDANEEACNFNTYEEKLLVKDFSEAVVIGAEVQDSHQYNLQLSTKGKLALLRSGVLLPYDSQLEIFRGSLRLSFADRAKLGIYWMILQCICQIVGRYIKGPRLSPLEAINCLLIIVVIIGGLKGFASSSHRPLLLYLPPGEEETFIEQCKSVKSFEFRTRSRFRRGVIMILASLSAVTVYFIFSFMKSVNVICVAPIIMFEVTVVLQGAQILLGNCFDEGRFQSSLLSKTLIVLLNGVAYVWAIVLSFTYWCTGE